MSATALLLYLTGLVLVFGVRTFLAWRATGDTRFRRPETRAFTPPWWGTVLFVLAWLLGLAAPVTAIATGSSAASPLVGWSGIGVMATGLLLVLAAQAGMSDSWRIGVQEGEHTALVTGGLFALVRNPVFTGMAVLLVGMALALPGALSPAALLVLVAGVQVQVRLIEEPYLLRTHGTAYRAYAARTGRFVPMLGRLTLSSETKERR
ncbi:methyltransferase family protein [Nocardiopsis deserti]|uniref:methyltransferase family protein n=1 Tax=Nocardiopsis deserti TaxID=2605988 RepID=UPI00123C53AE|nr:isoprenylcysteine carboxylmethyltransferase family protein [Nocardiopsis deserti]